MIDLLNNNFGGDRRGFTPTEYIQIYTECYEMCTQSTPYNWVSVDRLFELVAFLSFALVLERNSDFVFVRMTFLVYGIVEMIDLTSISHTSC